MILVMYLIKTDEILIVVKKQCIFETSIKLFILCHTLKEERKLCVASLMYYWSGI